MYVSASAQKNLSIESCIVGIFSFSVILTVEHFSHLSHGDVFKVITRVTARKLYCSHYTAAAHVTLWLFSYYKVFNKWTWILLFLLVVNLYFFPDSNTTTSLYRCKQLEIVHSNYILIGYNSEFQLSAYVSSYVIKLAQVPKCAESNFLTHFSARNTISEIARQR